MAKKKATQPKTRIIKRGRGHSYELDGEKVVGVTTAMNGIPKGALVPWAAGVVAEKAYDDPDYFETQRTKLDREDFIRWAKELRFKSRDNAANRGTEVHNIAEKILRGEDVRFTDELAGHVDSYIGFLNDFEPDLFAVELVVVSRRYGYMGRLDAMWWINGFDGLRIDDIKTTRTGIYPDTAVQQAAYAAAETFLVPAPAEQTDAMREYLAGVDLVPDAVKPGDEAPMPEVSGVGAVWVRADGYDHHDLEFDPVPSQSEPFRVFIHGFEVAKRMELPDWKTKPANDWVRPATVLEP